MEDISLGDLRCPGFDLGGWHICSMVPVSQGLALGFLLDGGILDFDLLCMPMDGALLSVMFLVHTQTKDDAYDLGFNYRVCLWFYSDGALDRRLGYEFLCMI